MKPHSSIERSQASDTLDGVVAVWRRFAGVVGAVTSGAVLPVIGALSWDSLPALSTALIRNENCLPGTSPPIVLAGGFGEPQRQPPAPMLIPV